MAITINFCDRDEGANMLCKLVARSLQCEPSYSFLSILQSLTLHAGRDCIPGTRVMTPVLLNNLPQSLTTIAVSTLGGYIDVGFLKFLNSLC